ncbi:MAG: MBOAT family protein [Flavobacteriales bacterium]|nr:MBOAT family protein [Flavobacteriales bacterium]
MLFNSIEFAVFLPLVFAVYWMIGSSRVRSQNAWLLVASYVFYGWWDWRFLSLILFSSLLDYTLGLRMARTEHRPKRKALLILSLCVNLGFLGFFKYYNFFLDNLAQAFTLFGQPLEMRGLDIILPVGISFYTFQTLSYTLDIYRGRLQPTNDPLSFLAFVSFFPQLVAGPIERASNLLPQFQTPRTFDRRRAEDGMRQMLWGFFKKVVIADNCAIIVNEVYADIGSAEPYMLAIAALLFTFQIYCDFSGYSDIAIGCARLFGFDLMRNFAFPYFSRDIAEFWRRWHISLSTWFRDYLYIPLGGSRGGRWMKVRNTMIIFIVSGFWHGANWTFIVWGALNAIFFLPLLLSDRNRTNLDDIASSGIIPSWRELRGVFVTFTLTNLAWVFFRAESVHEALVFLERIFTEFPASYHQIVSFLYFIPTSTLFACIAFMFGFEWLNRRQEHGLEVARFKAITRRSMYVVVLLLIFVFGSFDKQTFIYFQF